MWWMWLTLALAEPLTVVAVGDTPLAAPARVDAGPTQISSWVSVVGDCLEESHPGAVIVIDRTAAGDTAVAVQQRMDDLRSLQPDAVVVSLGGTDLATDPTATEPFAVALGATLDMMGPDDLHRLVVGLVPGPQALPTGPWNAALRDVVGVRTSATFVDMGEMWPSDPEKVGTMLQADGNLSARGHATVGASVCLALQHALMGPADANEDDVATPPSSAPSAESE